MFVFFSIPTFITLIANAFIVTPTTPGRLLPDVKVGVTGRKGSASAIPLTHSCLPGTLVLSKSEFLSDNDHQNWVLPLIIDRGDSLNPDENQNNIPMNRVPQSPGFKLYKENRFYDYEL